MDSGIIATRIWGRARIIRPIRQHIKRSHRKKRVHVVNTKTQVGIHHHNDRSGTTQACYGGHQRFRPICTIHDRNQTTTKKEIKNYGVRDEA